MGTAPPSIEEQIDDRIRRYRECKFDEPLMLRQLVAAGFPIESLKARFSHLSESIFASLQPQLPKASMGSTTASRALRSVTPKPTGPVEVSQILERMSRGSAHERESKAAQLPVTLPQSITKIVAPPESLSFQYIPLIQCSMPHADPGSQAVFSRRNGWTEVTLATVQADRIGLPYGVPARLLTIFIFSEAIRTRSREIYLGKSVHDFLRRLDVPITRGQRGSLRMYSDQLLRLVHCTATIYERMEAPGRTGLDIKNKFLIEGASLWWDNKSGVVDQGVIELSESIYQSVLQRAAPLSTAALKSLRKSPMDLDVYAWLVHRLFQMVRPSQITWQQLSDQFGHAYTALRDFRRAFTDSLPRALKAYPEAKVEVNDRGVMLLPSRPHIPHLSK